MGNTLNTMAKYRDYGSKTKFSYIKRSFQPEPPHSNIHWGTSNYKTVSSHYCMINISS